MANREDLRSFVEQIVPDDETLESYPVAPPGGSEAAHEGAEIAELAEGPSTGPPARPIDVASAIEHLTRGEELTPTDEFTTEAIIIPELRPVVDVIDGSYPTPGHPFERLGEQEVRSVLEPALRSVGRIEVPALPNIPFGGTGFVVGPDLMMTNRHVAELFSTGLGREQLAFRVGHSADIDFLRERDGQDAELFRVVRIVAIHPFWDMALLQVEGLMEADHPPLVLATAPPDALENREVAVIGYPAFDHRNDADVQRQVFGGRYNVKRIQPGLVRQVADTNSFGNVVAAMTHDSSTLGGNSGSALIDVESGKVLGLHFAGRYLVANYAVPMHELARDPVMYEVGLQFDADDVVDTSSPWRKYWILADDGGVEARASGSAGSIPPAPPQSTGAIGSGAAASITLPLEITVRIGSDPMITAGSGLAGPSLVEALVEPFRELDLETRAGYDPDFLGIPVPLPAVTAPDLVSGPACDDPELRYEHFSVVMNRERRLAFFTASNVAADPDSREPEPGFDYGRDGLTGLGENDQEKWFTDPRIPAVHQLPDRFFTKDRTAFDKGHLVRRDDVTWGMSFAEVRRANGDTFHVTNCSPQVAGFNRSNKGGAWGKLENLILKQAEAERLSLFAGPVLSDDDPEFHGVDDRGATSVRIPRQYWKIVLANAGGELQSFAFCLDHELDDVDLGVRPEEEFAVPADWRHLLISTAELEAKIAPLVLPAEVHDADQSGGA